MKPWRLLNSFYSTGWMPFP